MDDRFDVEALLEASFNKQQKEWSSDFHERPSKKRSSSSSPEQEYSSQKYTKSSKYAKDDNRKQSYKEKYDRDQAYAYDKEKSRSSPYDYDRVHNQERKIVSYEEDRGRETRKMPKEQEHGLTKIKSQHHYYSSDEENDKHHEYAFEKKKHNRREHDYNLIKKRPDSWERSLHKPKRYSREKSPYEMKKRSQERSPYEPKRDSRERSPHEMKRRSRERSPFEMKRRSRERSPFEMKGRSRERSPFETKRHSRERSPFETKRRSRERSPFETKRRSRERSPFEMKRRSRERSPFEMKRRSRERSPFEMKRRSRERSPFEMKRRSRERSPFEMKRRSRERSPFEMKRRSRERSPFEMKRRSRERSPFEFKRRERPHYEMKPHYDRDYGRDYKNGSRRRYSDEYRSPRMFGRRPFSRPVSYRGSYGGSRGYDRNRPYERDYRPRSRSKTPPRRHHKKSKSHERSPSRGKSKSRSPAPKKEAKISRPSEEKPDRLHSNMELTQEERDERTVFCMQLSQRVAARDLENFFLPAGKVQDVRIIYDNKTRRSKGIAYVEFQSADSVATAMSYNGKKLHGAPMMVQMTQAEKNRVSTAMFQRGPMKLYVGSLHYNINEEMLRTIFEPFGQIDRIELLKDADTGRNKGYGFLTFHEAECAKKALETMNGYELVGRAIKVNQVVSERGDILATSELDTDVMDRAGIDLNATGRLQLMAKLAEGTGLELPHAAKKALELSNQKLAAAIIPQPMTTQCFMLTNMFDPTTESAKDWDVEIRNDVIDECRGRGGCVHVFVDKQSKEGHVYVKCPNLSSAAASVMALNGRYFAGRVIQATYVPVMNYHMLFPEAAGALKAL